MSTGATTRSSHRRVSVIGVLVLVAILVIGGIILAEGLSNSRVYFHTADEAVAKREQLGTQRFRIEGTVVPGSIERSASTTHFVIESNGTRVDVQNAGAPQGVFQEGVPIVAEGRFAADSPVFQSDQVLVKHSEEYKAKHPDRVDSEGNQRERSHS